MKFTQWVVIIMLCVAMAADLQAQRTDSQAQHTSGSAVVKRASRNAPLEAESVTSPPVEIKMVSDSSTSQSGPNFGFVSPAVVDQPISGTSGPFNTTNYKSFTSLTGPGVNLHSVDVRTSSVAGNSSTVPGSTVARGTTDQVSMPQSDPMTNFLPSSRSVVSTYVYTSDEPLRLELFPETNYDGPNWMLDLNLPVKTTGGLLLLGVGAIGLRRRRHKRALA